MKRVVLVYVYHDAMSERFYLTNLIILPVSQSGPPTLLCLTSGSMPWHLFLSVIHSRPNAEPGHFCLSSTWQICGQQTQHLMTSWHTCRRSSEVSDELRSYIS